MSSSSSVELRKEPLLPLFEPPPHAQTKMQDADERNRLERELRHIGSVISIFAYTSFVASLVCIAITGGIFFTSSTLSADRKAFLISIVGVCFLGMIIVILIARKHPTTLLLFNILLSIMSAFCLGLSITYAS